MHPIFPWQQNEWQYLLKCKTLKQLPHAILIQGIAGLGKTNLAKNLAWLLLCQNNIASDQPCGNCIACKLLTANNHPDFFLIKPEAVGKTIKIDEIREVLNILNNTPHQGGYRIVIIESPELLNIAAANALLKTLEEPTADTIMILVSANPALLPITIRSRCQSIMLHPPATTVSEEWLSSKLPLEQIKILLPLASNAPLQALDFADSEFLTKRALFFQTIDKVNQKKISSIQAAETVFAWGLENILLTWLYLVADLIKLKLKITSDLINQDQLDKILPFATKVNLNKLFSLKDDLYNIRRQLADRFHLNQQLLIESLMISWQRLTTN